VDSPAEGDLAEDATWCPSAGSAQLPASKLTLAVRDDLEPRHDLSEHNLQGPATFHMGLAQGAAPSRRAASYADSPGMNLGVRSDSADRLRRSMGHLPLADIVGRLQQFQESGLKGTLLEVVELGLELVQRNRELEGRLRDFQVGYGTQRPATTSSAASAQDAIESICLRGRIAYDMGSGVVTLSLPIAFQRRHFGTDYVDDATAAFLDFEATHPVLQDIVELQAVMEASAEVVCTFTHPDSSHDLPHVELEKWRRDLAESRAGLVAQALEERGFPKGKLSVAVGQVDLAEHPQHQSEVLYLQFHPRLVVQELPTLAPPEERREDAELQIVRGEAAQLRQALDDAHVETGDLHERLRQLACARDEALAWAQEANARAEQACCAAMATTSAVAIADAATSVEVPCVPTQQAPLEDDADFHEAAPQELGDSSCPLPSMVLPDGVLAQKEDELERLREQLASARRCYSTQLKAMEDKVLAAEGLAQELLARQLAASRPVRRPASEADLNAMLAPWSDGCHAESGQRGRSPAVRAGRVASGATSPVTPAERLLLPSSPSSAAAPPTIIVTATPPVPLPPLAEPLAAPTGGTTPLNALRAVPVLTVTTATPSASHQAQPLFHPPSGAVTPVQQHLQPPKILRAASVTEMRSGRPQTACALPGSSCRSMSVPVAMQRPQRSSPVVLPPAGDTAARSSQDAHFVPPQATCLQRWFPSAQLPVVATGMVPGTATEVSRGTAPGRTLQSSAPQLAVRADTIAQELANTMAGNFVPLDRLLRGEWMEPSLTPIHLASPVPWSGGSAASAMVSVASPGVAQSPQWAPAPPIAAAPPVILGSSVQAIAPRQLSLHQKPSLVSLALEPRMNWGRCSR